MKKVSRLVIAIVLSMTVAATASSTLAQNRPDCLMSGHPGACFVDRGLMDNLYLCGSWVDFAVSGDVDGSWALWTFPTDANDFVRVNTNNGEQLLHLNDTQADLWICPASAGGLGCLLEYLDTCVVPEGMLTGTGRISGTGAGAGGGCPHLAATGDGTVMNQSGQKFKVKFAWTLRPDPSAPRSSTQCVEVKHELSITLE